MKVAVLLALTLTIVLAQRRQVPDRQQIIERTGGDRRDNQDQGNSETPFFWRGRYGRCPGCRGNGPFGRMGPGPRWGFGPGGPWNGPYGRRGPGARWGYGPGGPQRMLDIWRHHGSRWRGYGDEVPGPYGGFYHGHGHGHQICPPYCPAGGDPVCASDGRTYASRCLMQMEACRTGESLTVVKTGAC